MSGRGIFVSGTGTGVGKTIVSASLVRALRERGVNAVGLKPIASGVSETTSWQDDDAKLLAAASGIADVNEISFWRLKRPLAPYTAAQLEGRLDEYAAIAERTQQAIYRNDFSIVEGVGGAAVPLHGDILVSDWASRLRLPVLVVSRSDLGTVNHTILTVEHLRGRGCSVAGAVFVRHSEGPLSEAEETGPALAEAWIGVPNFGLLPYCAAIPHSKSADEALQHLPWQSQAIQNVLVALDLPLNVHS